MGIADNVGTRPRSSLPASESQKECFPSPASPYPSLGQSLSSKRKCARLAPRGTTGQHDPRPRKRLITRTSNYPALSDPSVRTRTGPDCRIRRTCGTLHRRGLVSFFVPPSGKRSYGNETKVTAHGRVILRHAARRYEYGVALATREDPGDPSRLHTWFGCRACTRNTHRIHSTPVSSLLKLTHHTQSRYVASSDRLVWSPLLHVPARAHEIQGRPRGASHRQPEPPPTTAHRETRLVDGLDGLHYPHTKMLSVQHGLAKSTLDDYTNIGSASSSIKGLP